MDKPKTNIPAPKQYQLELSEDVREGKKKPSFFYDTSSVPVLISDDRLKYVDQRVIAPKYYNNFNFSKLSKKYEELKVTLGITSANKGEGKTLVASNMAVSLAQGYQQRTILVDLNFESPQLHNVFGAPQGPGMAEAMKKRMLRINPTAVDDLFLLTAGRCDYYKPGIEDTMALRDILYTLKNEFDFIIVDMSAIFPVEEFPIHFINEIDGLITVVDTKNTRKEHLRNIYKHIDENRFVGYIFNKVDDKN